MTAAPGVLGVAEAGCDGPFGPLVATACYLDDRGRRALAALELPPEGPFPPRTLTLIARKLRAVVPYEVVTVGPARLNALLKKKPPMDMAQLRAWALAKALTGLLAAYPRCTQASGVGLDGTLPVEDARRGAGGELTLLGVDHPTATPETHAAWLLAEAEFLRRLHRLSDELQVALPSEPAAARKTAQELTARGGMSTLRQCAKLQHPAFQELG